MNSKSEVVKIQAHTNKSVECLGCGKTFVQKTVIQKYCSKSCGRKYRSSGNYDRLKEFPSVCFYCKNCGREVVTMAGEDKRTVFCSSICEGSYWTPGKFRGRENNENTKKEK